MEKQHTAFWIKISLINLLIVGLLGVLMRYKIGFEFPYFDQRNLQHAHSHFAFAGWVSQTLLFLMILSIGSFLSSDRVKLYQYLLIANLICSFGMLISFAIQGYGAFSIFFSTTSIVVSFLFCYFFLKDVLPNKIIAGRNWFIAALLFNILSALGTFALVYMMATKNIPQHSYLASVYWYLHFQYNGWFFFACMGLFQNYLNTIAPELYKKTNNTFWYFGLSCLPAYGLSTLWVELPFVVYALIIVAALLQFWGWFKFIFLLIQSSFLKIYKEDFLIKVLFIAIGLAGSIKFCLQLGSTIPFISKLAFGFRPIVIAYLHLVLLAFTSIFLITYIYALDLIKKTKQTIVGIGIFVLGVFANELILTIQGVASFSYTIIPLANEGLLLVSFFIVIGLMLIFLSQFEFKKTQ